MKLYQTPGGTWAGSEKDWKDAVKAEGLDPKKLDRKVVEVPVSKAELMEWLTFHNVNVISPPTAKGVQEVRTQVLPPPPAPASNTGQSTVSDLDAAFAAAHVSTQLRLAVCAIDNADARLRAAS